jgi:hypothetical protein
MYIALRAGPEIFGAWGEDKKSGPLIFTKIINICSI